MVINASSYDFIEREIVIVQYASVARNLAHGTNQKVKVICSITLGDPGFPLNSIYTKPSSAEESDLIRQYFLQLRHETGEKKIF